MVRQCTFNPTARRQVQEDNGSSRPSGTAKTEPCAHCQFLPQILSMSTTNYLFTRLAHPGFLDRLNSRYSVFQIGFGQTLSEYPAFFFQVLFFVGICRPSQAAKRISPCAHARNIHATYRLLTDRLFPARFFPQLIHGLVDFRFHLETTPLDFL